jgi:hypothetical protein
MWICEEQACSILGYTNALAFRRNVKAEKIPVRWRSTLGRSFQYNLPDIERYQRNTVGVGAAYTKHRNIEAL